MHIWSIEIYWRKAVLGKMRCDVIVNGCVKHLLVWPNDVNKHFNTRYTSDTSDSISMLVCSHDFSIDFLVVSYYAPFRQEKTET